MLLLEFVVTQLPPACQLCEHIPCQCSDTVSILAAELIRLPVLCDVTALPLWWMAQHRGRAPLWNVHSGRTKVKKNSQACTSRIPTVSFDHSSAEAAEEIKAENIRQKEEQYSNQARWKGAAWGLGLMSLTSPHGLQGRTPLKWVNFAPVITAQTQRSHISLSTSHHHIEGLRESWLTKDIVLKWAASLTLPPPSAHQVLSVTFPDGLCNAKTEQLWQENIQNISVILQDNQKR